MKHDLNNAIDEPVHARPIWYSDEARLISATSACTMGLMDKALLRVLVETGGRGSDIAEMTMDRHVFLRRDQRDEPRWLLTVPNIKNERGDMVEHWLGGDAFVDLKKWIERRLVIFPESPFLFLTTSG